AWSNLSGSVGVAPPGRWNAAVAFDPVVGGLVLFGGENQSGCLNDSWLLKGSAWSKLTTSHAPGPRSRAAMAYDPNDGYLLLYGGGSRVGGAARNSAWFVHNDTWNFSGSAWTNLTSAVAGSPGSRMSSGIVYIPSKGRVYMTGGTNGSAQNITSRINDTWA